MSGSDQYVSDSSYHIKYNMFDVRLVTKLGMHYKQNAWAFGVNINLPSLKIFGDGTVVRQYEYSNIHKDTDNPEGSGRIYGGRQSGCTAHFKDPLSVAAGANFYSPSGKSILLFTAEYFVGIKDYDYIEAHSGTGENGYNFTPVGPEEWLTFTRSHEPVFNAGIAFKQHLNSDIMISGGFRTDFRYSDSAERPGIPVYNEKASYPMSVYHFNSGMGYNFKKGSIILGMQFTYGQDKNQKQIVNLTNPVEYISETIIPLTGELNRNVLIRYYDITVYLGFLFNFMKE